MTGFYHRIEGKEGGRGEVLKGLSLLPVPGGRERKNMSDAPPKGEPKKQINMSQNIDGLVSIAAAKSH